MFKAIYKSTRLITGNPESNVAIVCLWTKAKEIAEKIDPSKYAVMGQLFSAERGLDILVRNLLANPDITNLIITGNDLSKSGIVLKDFFEKGFERGKTEVTGKPVWRVKSTYPGYIELDIPESALNQLRETINVTWVENIEKFDFSKLIKPEKRREKMVFEKKEEEIKKYHGEDAVYVVRHEKVAGVWLKILDTILKYGYKSRTHYDDEQKEILNLVSVITNEDPNNFHVPEFLPCSKEQIENYIPKVTTDYKEEGITYTYGSRMRSWFGKDQVKEAVAKLVRELNSRAVVINLWDSTQDLTIGGSPCINHIWLRVREDRLYMTVTIRSNDMFEAYPENAFGMRALQEVIRKELISELKKKGTEKNIKLGSLIINSQSAHIYDDCFYNAQKIVKEHLPKYTKLPGEDLDPRGSFVIETADGKIKIEHISPTNEVLGVYEGETALELRDILISENLFGNPAHALYLGTELMKAEIALKNGLEYEQDGPLRLEKQTETTQTKESGTQSEPVIQSESLSQGTSKGFQTKIVTYINAGGREIKSVSMQKKEDDFERILRSAGLCRIFN